MITLKRAIELCEEGLDATVYSEDMYWLERSEALNILIRLAKEVLAWQTMGEER